MTIVATLFSLDSKLRMFHFKMSDLSSSINLCFQLAKPFTSIDYSSAKVKVTNALDLNAIGEKIEANLYNSFEAFLSDVKWIAHNTKVHRSSEFGTIPHFVRLISFTILI